MDEENQLAIVIMEIGENDIDIRKKLKRVKIGPERSSYIREVPKHLCDVNAKAYDPQIIAIGPYHRGKRELEKMEEYKLRYLKMLLRTKKHGLKRCMKAMKKLRKRARASYADSVSLIPKDEFVEMMLLDACFIVELFRNYWRKSEHNESLFDSRMTEQKLRRDLLLAENQIPFFVLYEFFKMTKTPEEEQHLHGETEETNHFLTMIFAFFASALPNQCYEQDAEESFSFSVLAHQSCEQDAEEARCHIVQTTGGYLLLDFARFQDSNAIKHLLSLVHDGWVDLVVPKSATNSNRNCSWKIFKIFKDYCSFPKKKEKNGSDHRRCATKLEEAGIKFKEAKSNSLFDIKFEHGVMRIPRLRIDDGTESFFQNLIAYEQLFPENSNHVIDYMNFMNSLVNSEKDVELLCQHEIVDNFLGDDKVVAEMFNRLGDSITLSPSDHYKNVYKDVSKYCGKTCNKWMANLRHNYFNSPWALISFLAAVLLLLLTVGQTVFSVLAYFK